MGGFPTRQRLAHWMQVDTGCPQCGWEDETIMPLFIKIPFSVTLWGGVGRWL
eukprot:c44645_g1_i1 orf=96-251(+)